MRVAVTGASGYLGSAVQIALLEAGHMVTAISRSGRAVPGARGVAADVTAADLTAAFLRHDAVVHLVGIIREDPAAGVTFERLHVEATRRVATTAASTGITRVVMVSALGTAPDAPGRYFKTKWQAETVLRSQCPTATIVRPSLLFGGAAPFFQMLRQLARQPVVPVPGPGTTRFDPVARRDVARALAAMVNDPEADGAVYEVGGPRRYTLDGLIDLAAAVNGRATPVPKWHMPLGWLQPVVRALEGFSAFPVTTDQLAMLNRDNITDDIRWHRWVPEPEAPGRDL